MRLAHASWSTPTGPAGLVPDPAEPAGLRPRRRRVRRRLRLGRGRRHGRLRPAPRPPSGTPDVILIAHRLRGAARRRGPRAPAGRGHRRPASCRCRAWSGSTSRTPRYREPVLPPAVKARVSRRGRHRPGLARRRRRRRPHRLASSTSAPPPTTRPCSASSASPPRPSSPRPRSSLAAAPAASHGTTPARHSQEVTHDRTHCSSCPTPASRIWLDDLSRERLATGNLAELIARPQRRRRHHQPDDLRGGARPRATRYDEQVARARRRAAPTSTRPSSTITTDDVRDACDVFRPVYDATGRRRRPGVDRGRPPAWPTTPPRPSPRRRQLWRHGRPAQRADQDPGDRRGPARDHRGDRRRASASTSR